MSKLYRYALFGRTESGKTAQLTAMSLAHKAHPFGYTVTWVPQVPPEAAGDPKLAKEYQDGIAAMQRTRAEVEQGKNPLPTRPDQLYRYRFDFTVPPRSPEVLGSMIRAEAARFEAPEHRAEVLAAGIREVLHSGCIPRANQAAAVGIGGDPVDPETRSPEELQDILDDLLRGARPAPGRVIATEFVDFSGELLEPEASAQTVAGLLRELLATMDGLFVLAEAPRGHEGGDALHREFELLKQAFALLCKERRAGAAAARTPVVLGLNKWDRLYPEARPPLVRARQVKEFLHGTPEPDQLSLAHYLRGAVAEGCFNVVAASAYGRARRETELVDGVERETEQPPITRPLPSFGLEEGFVWAANRRDHADLQALEDRSERLRWGTRFPWFGLDALNPAPAFRLRAEAASVAARFPDQDELHQRANAVGRKTLRTAALRTATALAASVGFLLLAEGAFDVWRLRESIAATGRPGTQLADLEEQKGRLTRYARSHPVRHTVASLAFLSRNEAEQMVQQLDRRDQELSRNQMLALAPNTRAQAPWAKQFLEKFPNAQQDWRDEANKILMAADRDGEIEVQANTLKTYASKLQTLQDLSKTTIADVESHRREFEQEISRLGVHPSLESLVRKHRDDLNSLAVRLDRANAEARFSALLKDQKYQEAGSLAVTLAGKNVDERKKHAAATVVSVRNHIAEATTDKLYSKAHRLLEAVKLGWEQKGLFSSADLDVVARMRRDVYSAWDRYLYEAVERSPRDRDYCKAYLDAREIPDTYRLMTGVVRARSQYLAEWNAKKDRQLRLKLFHVGHRDWFVDPKFDVCVKCEGIVMYENSKDQCEPNFTYLMESSKTVTLTSKAMTDSVTFEVRFKYSDIDFGSGPLQLRLSEILDKQLIPWIAGAPPSGFPLPANKKAYADVTKPSILQFELRDPPVEPKLPPYAGAQP